MSIDLHSTPCTYYERVNYSGKWHIEQGHTALNHPTNVWDGLFTLTDETERNILTLREGLHDGQILDKQKFKKEKISGINGSCTCDTNYRDENHIIGYNGLMFLDIDSVEDLDEVKRKVNALPYTVLSAESVSGGGLFAIFAVEGITDGNDYRRAYRAALKYLHEQGLTSNCKIDRQTIDPTRFRYQTIDPHPYYNPDAEIWAERANDADIPTQKTCQKKEHSKSKKNTTPRITRQDFSAELLKEYWSDISVTDFKNKHLGMVKNVPYQTSFKAVEGKDYLVRDGVNCQMPRDYIREKGKIIGCRKWKTNRSQHFAIACAVVKYRCPDITADEFMLTMLHEFLTYYKVPRIDKRRTLSIIATEWNSKMEAIEMKKRRCKVNPQVAREKGMDARQLQQTALMHYRWDYVFNPASLYDDTMTITQNLKAMAEQGHPIDRKTLKNALTEQGIMTYEQYNDYSALLMYPYEVPDGYIAEKCHLSRPTVNKRRNEWWQRIEAQQDTAEEVEEQLRMIGFDETEERELEEIFNTMQV